MSRSYINKSAGKTHAHPQLNTLSFIVLDCLLLAGSEIAAAGQDIADNCKSGGLQHSIKYHNRPATHRLRCQNRGNRESKNIS